MTKARTRVSVPLPLDEFGRELMDAGRWAEAETLAELGEFTAQWLEGRIGFHPGYLASTPAEETRELVPVLAGLNRAGYLTDFSQPGRPVIDGCGQRAAVGGFCEETLAERLDQLSAVSDLIVLTYWPGPTDELRVPVTILDGEQHTWVGGSPVPKDIVYGQLDGGSVGAAFTLMESCHVTVLDPCWGRNDVL